MLIRIFVILSYLAVVLFCHLVKAESPLQEKQNLEKRIEIHFDDLKNNYQIIGRLGKPVGEYHTIHGTWKRFDFSSKKLFLYVTHINYKRLSKPIIFPERYLIKCGTFTPELEIDPETSSYWKNRNLFCCEYRIFEKIGITGFPDDYWKESSEQTAQALYYAKSEQENRDQPFELASCLLYVRSKFVKLTDDYEEQANKAIGSTVTTTSSEVVTEQPRDRIGIRFDDLRDRYRIIGRLGKPMGEYSTIRGVWKKERVIRDRRMVRFMRFYVTHIDGRVLKESLDFDQRDGIFRNYSWIPLDPPVPRPEEHNVWELRVVESMSYSGLAKNYNREIGYPGCLELNWIPDFKLNSTLRYHHRPQIIKSAKKPIE